MRATICRRVIVGRSVRNDDGSECPNRQDIVPPLKARSLANERLIRFFGIDNAFTTDDEQYKDWFVNQASLKLGFRSHRWQKIIDSACSFVQRQVHNTGWTEIYLVPFAQTTTLAVVLEVLFPHHSEVSVDKFNYTTLFNVARCINQLWNDSKHDGEPRDSLRKDLEAGVAELIPDCSFKPRDNPYVLTA
jgi:hypothetical protein